jgi:hypothetical protein
MNFSAAAQESAAVKAELRRLPAADTSIRSRAENRSSGARRDSWEVSVAITGLIMSIGPLRIRPLCCNRHQQPADRFDI